MKVEPRLLKKNWWRLVGLTGSAGSLGALLALQVRQLAAPSLSLSLIESLSYASAPIIVPGFLCILGFVLPKDSKIGSAVTFVGLAGLSFFPALMGGSYGALVFFFPSNVAIAYAAILRMRKAAFSVAQSAVVIVAAMFFVALLPLGLLLLNDTFFDTPTTQGLFHIRLF